jgi:hypothetical protein
MTSSDYRQDQLLMPNGCPGATLPEWVDHITIDNLKKKETEKTKVMFDIMWFFDD